ncbi:hypothetical protein LXA43DRAFT_1104287 [Ganoderma leucocontextum]|nr:hypothetical protein LXA43DRAFT_1104287 [Ganoderma leucocontextum]
MHSEDSNSGILADTELSQDHPDAAFLSSGNDVGTSSELSPLPQVVIDFFNMSPPYPRSVIWVNSSSLESRGPRDSSANLLHAYYKLSLPGSPTGAESVDVDLPLDNQTKARAYSEFRKFAKTAARSCVLLSQPRRSLDDVRASYISLLEGLEGLRGYLRELPYGEQGWIDDGSLPLPALFTGKGVLCMRKEDNGDPEDDGDPELEACGGLARCVEKAMMRGDRGGLGEPMTPLRLVHPAPVLPPLYPLEVVQLPLDSTSLIVPTSCPHELEYPYMLVPSVEVQVQSRK